MKLVKIFYLTIFIFFSNSLYAAQELKIKNAWIRLAPPGAAMLAGYCEMENAGEKTVLITGTQSTAFGEVSLHETVQKEGRARMQSLEKVETAPGEKVIFAPGGKHLMLMNPVKPLSKGDSVEIIFTLDNGSSVSANFTVKESED